MCGPGRETITFRLKYEHPWPVPGNEHHPVPAGDRIHNMPQPRPLPSQPVRAGLTGKTVLAKLRYINLFRLAEVRLLLAGILMSLALLAAISYFWITDISTAKTLLLALLAHLFGGRAAGVGLCIMNNFNLVWTALYNFYLELLIICFTYSIFVLSINNYIKARWIKTLTGRFAEKAQKHRTRIENHGWIGLFVFVMVPLPVTGPVFGVIIGFLLQVKLWHNLTAVSLGTLTAIIVWVIGFDFLEQHFQAIQWVFAGIVTVVIISYFNTLKNWFFK